MNKQPDLDIQKVLDAMANDTPLTVNIPNTKRSVKIGWIRTDTIRKITGLYLNKRTDSRYERQIGCRMAALGVLNGYWKIKLFYPFLWRWYYYIRQYHDYQLLPIVEEIKKKVVPIPSWLVMTYLQGLSDTAATMTRKEVAASRQEPS